MFLIFTKEILNGKIHFCAVSGLATVGQGNYQELSRNSYMVASPLPKAPYLNIYIIYSQNTAPKIVCCKKCLL